MLGQHSLTAGGGGGKPRGPEHHWCFYPRGQWREQAGPPRGTELGGGSWGRRRGGESQASHGCAEASGCGSGSGPAVPNPEQCRSIYPQLGPASLGGRKKARCGTMEDVPHQWWERARWSAGWKKRTGDAEAVWKSGMGLRLRRLPRISQHR